MKKMLSIFDALVTAGGYAAAFSGFVLTGVVVFGVFTRYVLHTPSDWTMEISQYIFCAMSLFGTGYALKEGAHVRIDLVWERMPPRVREYLDLVQYPIIVCICLILIWMGGEEFWSALTQNKRSETVLSLPLWPVWSTIPIGGLLLLMSALSGLVKQLLNLFNPDHKG
jgi:TRAP-type C4-dicarboxylate transport system permease small subunit